MSPEARVFGHAEEANVPKLQKQNRTGGFQGCPSMGYGCKYAPIELLKAFGIEPVALDRWPLPQGARDLHPNLCSFANGFYGRAFSALQTPETSSGEFAMLTEKLALDDDASSSIRGVLLTDCCDALRRVGDALAASFGDEVVMLELPHCGDGCSLQREQKILMGLVEDLERRTQRSFDSHRFLMAWQEAAPPRDLTEPYCALIGARVSPELLEELGASLDFPLVDFTCQGSRRLPPLTHDLTDADLETLMGAYAQALYGQVPCLRMADIQRRRALFEDPQLVAIVYSTLKFCDYYGFEQAAVESNVSVPMVTIESEYDRGVTEQIKTRLAAFQEQLSARYGFCQPMTLPTDAKVAKEPTADEASRFWPESTSMNALKQPQNQDEANVSKLAERAQPLYYVGIDSGSTSTNLVALDDEGRLIAAFSRRTGAKAIQSAKAALDELSARLGITPEAYATIVGTGYGRNHLDFVHRSVTEITAHGRSAAHMYPEVRSVIDIGGQDSKVIRLDKAGHVISFAMNDKCAAGTGRFFEAMARTLEMDLETMAAMTTWKRDLTLSSLCTVFAESEVIGLIADNCDSADIVHGLNKAVATRTAGLVERSGAQGPFLMTGGVARNLGLVKALGETLRAPIQVAQNPEMMGALGAALIGLDQANAPICQT